LLRAQLAEQSSTLLERHPRIQELNAQINALDTQMRGELERLVLSIENDARIATARVEQTSDAINRIKNQISSASPQDVQLRALEREAKAQRDLLESYLARYREATARENIDSVPAEARVISRATVSNVPAFPKVLPILIVTTLATLFLLAAFVLSSEIMRQGVPTRARLRRAASEPVTPAGPMTPDTPAPAPSKTRRSLFALFRRKGSAPTAGREWTPIPEIEVPAPAAPKADRIETLANALTAMGEPGRRIVLLGAGRNVGTTYAALALARALSAKGGRVVLADLALTAPNLSVTSSDPQAPGFAELVRGTASFGDIITRDKFSRVHLVSTGQVTGDAAAIFASPRLTITLEALARAYDHLVIDGGSVGEAPVKFLAGIAPRVVLVAKDPAASAALDARATLTAAGFADVASIQGGADQPGTESVAA
jgi:succinoglycan biosynthesis transport protein ExoP